jgi:beta-phosphoglucomutase-like phosphatase (HAD superfamily)
VKAGAAAGFKHVIGIDREQADDGAHARALRASGADLVTRDLRDILSLCLAGDRMQQPQ